MRHRLCWFRLTALCAAIPACSGDPFDWEAGRGDPSGERESEGEATFAPEEPTELWFVELEGEPPGRRGLRALGLDIGRDQRDLFRRHAALVGLRYQQRFAFEELWNGLSLRVAPESSALLSSIPGVRAIYPVVPITLDAVQEASAANPDLTAASALSGADVVRREMGVTGAQLRVGVIDSGIDYHHPDLGGCFGPGCRVAFGHDFVGDDFVGSDPTTQPVPDGDPDDCFGHGTHVAGIIGANGALQGVAPDVVLGAYRVFGCRGGSRADVILKAMERAAQDDMRVVNISIGSPFQWPRYPTAAAASELVARGVVVVASIGNNGEKGLWAAGAPGVGEAVIGTASIENDRVTRLSFTLSPDGRAVGYDRVAGSPPPPIAGGAPLARTGTVTSTDDACAELPEGSLEGAIALVRRGGCLFHRKAANAQAAGAAGVVIYSDRHGSVSGSLAIGAPITIPVVSISQADGELIDARLDAGPVTLRWTDRTVGTALPTGGRISSFSSWGMSAALTFKPDLAAPGGSIFSTVPLEKGAYATFSGTSMAAPHVAGAVALLLSARPEIPASLARDVLQNSAVPVPLHGGAAGRGALESAHRQGAGGLRIDRAIRATTVILPGKLSLGESEAGPVTRVLTLTNLGGAGVTYALSHAPAAASPGGDHWSPTSAMVGAATVHFRARRVTVPAGGSAAVAVTIAANPALADGSLFGGYLVFTPEGCASDGALRVPYAGFKGDYQGVPVLTAVDHAAPWLGQQVGAHVAPRPRGATYTLEDGDFPVVIAHLDHGVERLTMDVFDATTMKPWGRAMSFAYVGQSMTRAATSRYVWKGKTQLDRSITLVPNGDYVLRLSVLKALGDPSNAAHWESWTSPVVTLNRR